MVWYCAGMYSWTIWRQQKNRCLTHQVIEFTQFQRGTTLSGRRERATEQRNIAHLTRSDAAQVKHNGVPESALLMQHPRQQSQWVLYTHNCWLSLLVLKGSVAWYFVSIQISKCGSRLLLKCSGDKCICDLRHISYTWQSIAGRRDKITAWELMSTSGRLASLRFSYCCQE